MLLFFSASPGAQAQDSAAEFTPNDDAVHVVTYVETTSAGIPRAIGLLHLYREAGRMEPGNTSLELRQEVGRPYRFAVVAQWEDQAAYEAHERGAEAMQLFAGLNEIQTAPPEKIVLQNFAVGLVRPSGGGRAQVYGITHIEIPSDRLAEFRALLSPFVETSRSDGGGMRFDVLQRLDPQQNHLFLFESWTNPGDFEAHRSSEHAKNFREGLAAMLADLVDDRLYGAFD
jgi:quinol monooxygenase YgiN